MENKLLLPPFFKDASSSLRIQEESSKKLCRESTDLLASIHLNSHSLHWVILSTIVLFENLLDEGQMPLSCLPAQFILHVVTGKDNNLYYQRVGFLSLFYFLCLEQPHFLLVQIYSLKQAWGEICGFQRSIS